MFSLWSLWFFLHFLMSLRFQVCQTNVWNPNKNQQSYPPDRFSYFVIKRGVMVVTHVKREKNQNFPGNLQIVLNHKSPCILVCSRAVHIGKWWRVELHVNSLSSSSSSVGGCSLLPERQLCLLQVGEQQSSAWRAAAGVEAWRVLLYPMWAGGSRLHRRGENPF